MKRLWFGLLLVLCQSVWAGPRLQVITENWRPYNYEQNGEVKGSATEIVRQVLDLAGVEYDIAVYPWTRAYHMAQHRDNVLIYSMMRTPQREALFNWIRPLAVGRTTALYRLKHSPLALPKTLDEIKQMEIVTNKDSMDHLWLTANGFGRLHTPITLTQSVRLFYRGRVGLIAIDNASIASEFNNQGLPLERVEMVRELFTAEPYMALSLGSDPDLAAKLKHAYDLLLEKGKIALIQ